jgi:hypothetical protein
MDGVEVIGGVGEDYKPGVSFYGLICFIYGQHAIRLKDMEQLARRDAICQSLAKFYDSQEALKVNIYMYIYKCTNRDSLKSTPYFLPFNLLSSNRMLRRIFGPKME